MRFAAADTKPDPRVGELFAERSDHWTAAYRVDERWDSFNRPRCSTDRLIIDIMSDSWADGWTPSREAESALDDPFIANAFSQSATARS